MKDQVSGKSIELSIVVASLYGESPLAACLASILANKTDRTEIIVADCSLKDKFVGWKEKYPAVEFIGFSEKTTLPALLSAGIARTRGPVIAVTDSACEVSENWITAVRQAHQADRSPVIGGAVKISGEKKNLTEWAAYLCDYGQFMPPAPRGVVPAVPGNNFSFKRRALAIGTEYVAKEFWKSHWCRVLKAAGIELISAPSVQVSWRKTYRLIPFLTGRFAQGRSFAALRFFGQTVSFEKRFLYCAGSALLPFILLLRTMRTVLPKKRFPGKLLVALPLIFSAHVCWAFGEAIGYLYPQKTTGDFER